MRISHILPLVLLWLTTKPCPADDSPLQDMCPAATPIENPSIFMNGLPCKNPNDLTASDFKTSELRHGGDIDNFLRSSVKIVAAAEFPGLNTQGLSIARTDLGLDGMVLLHAHPRAAELLYVHQGTLTVGFLDTASRPYQTSLKQGDVFLFPRGLLHYCVNGGYELATTYSVFNSQNPGVVSIAESLFRADSDMMEKLVSWMATISVKEIDHSGNVTVASES